MRWWAGCLWLGLCVALVVWAGLPAADVGVGGLFPQAGDVASRGPGARPVAAVHGPPGLFSGDDAAVPRLQVAGLPGPAGAPFV